MELEEAIKILNTFKGRQKTKKYNRISLEDIEAIETVLNQLEQYKRLAGMNLKSAEEFQNNMCEHRCILYNEKEELKSDLYEANNIISDYIDTTAKQDKMIELMLDFLECLQLSKDIEGYESMTKEDWKQYFKKKAEEAE